MESDNVNNEYVDIVELVEYLNKLINKKYHIVRIVQHAVSKS